jgi:hypothetical protein
MPNTSATGGYIAGTGAVVEDSALDAIFQAAVVGITGLPGAMVRPRWQRVVPKQPEPDTDWCAIGVTASDTTDYPVEQHVGTGDGSDDFQKWEELDLLASFYGTNAASFCSLLRDGLYVTQNREVLQAGGIDLIEVGRRITAPDLVNQQWIRRFDLPIRFRRKVERSFPVLNILSAPDSIATDSNP